MSASKIERLIRLAVDARTPTEEARTAAMIACRMIFEEGFEVPKAAPAPRPAPPPAPRPAPKPKAPKPYKVYVDVPFVDDIRDTNKVPFASVADWYEAVHRSVRAETVGAAFRPEGLEDFARRTCTGRRTAKFNGTCRACGNPIDIGTEIGYSEIHGVYTHEECT